MRHKKQNNIHSTSNHNDPQHQKYPTQPAPQNEKRSVLTRIAQRFKEKPATQEEVKQLGLNAKREVYKTAIAKAKAGRPSRFSGFISSTPPSGYRRSREQDSGSFLFGGSGKESSFLDFGSGPSLSFLTDGSEKKSRGKPQKSGLEEMF